ncbi:flagellar biosynthesis protein FlhB [candidate division WOR-1 bacterium RIFOXYD2_FULL_36_8]|uniref:Flagellar biosynthetic protein FlhB n=1 Tax=candidate division WOR-1 bacterium RIFOXYB2_FULL_36_35 TaxID=1802578 RepID=A0A1F4RZ95_UNCSA|nr:MAG: flagellar biosynthesis protein FlhB [candidate division WOR-1 bacterium RIFOXYA2_FULL_36_21]OGC12783.1 MAG: flagellar biosynthesis protein FlhB [candidate division WOR-1 bacterium RIFOXYB2_FULL_36_35]OGC15210.1 MAG: flagellar biosynthesis protein FlhB [candidate division WOR-1 bacterium RIFOXYA12_FULL_36_13]OGC38342.1 MAG: flagellar biosynthesis protein FlhB [candidate division WOR-1 bacterium RIFOXYD2_FULL_36_8]
MAEQGGDKTEEPTPHRLREAREKGQIAKSREVTTAVLLLLSYSVFRYFGEGSWTSLVQMGQGIFSQIPASANEFSFDFASYILLIGLKAFALALIPIFAVTFLAAIIVETMQTGFVFTGDPLSPKIERINPLEGFKKMFSLQGFVEVIKSILKIIIVFYIAWITVKKDLPYIMVLLDNNPWDSLLLGGLLAYTIAMRVGIFYIIIAFLDYLYRRWEYMKNLKMTRQEVKEEYKRLEGDPQVKQRIRDMARQIAYQRMMSSVPQADVVVTNPTHVACAVKYEQNKMKAPRLMAKGMRKHAEKIRQIAEEHEIPVVENEPLARSIYRTTKVGQEIPRELYQAVAEVLAYIYKKKKDKEALNKTIAGIPRG